MRLRRMVDDKYIDRCNLIVDHLSSNKIISHSCLCHFQCANGMQSIAVDWVLWSRRERTMLLTVKFNGTLI